MVVVVVVVEVVAGKGGGGGAEGRGAAAEGSGWLSVDKRGTTDTRRLLRGSCWVLVPALWAAFARDPQKPPPTPRPKARCAPRNVPSLRGAVPAEAVPAQLVSLLGPFLACHPNTGGPQPSKSTVLKGIYRFNFFMLGAIVAQN